MKKIFTILMILNIVMPAFAGDRHVCDLAVGSVQNEIKKCFGKRAVITEDSEGYQTWIYENPKKIPSATAGKFADVNSSGANTTLIIKFDDKGSVMNFSYIKSLY